ncbi:hypothetical protein Ancab_014551, partial [Ancistrocladus abbreviatus]
MESGERVREDLRRRKMERNLCEYVICINVCRSGGKTRGRRPFRSTQGSCKWVHRRDREVLLQEAIFPVIF